MLLITQLWAGMILGIFLANWIKFKAPSLTKPVGLDVGRFIFAAFHKVQFVLWFVLVISGWIIRFLLWSWCVVILIGIILIIQHFWLFPLLSQRVDVRLTGGQTAKSSVHVIYIILELVKLTLLFYFLKTSELYLMN